MSGRKVENIETLDLTAELRRAAFAEKLFENRFNATKTYQEVFGCSYATANAEATLYLRHPQVQAFITERQLAMQLAGQVRREEIVSELWDIVDECRKEKDRYNAIRALSEIAKIGGLHTTNVHITHSDKDVQVINIIEVPYSGTQSQNNTSLQT